MSDIPSDLYREILCRLPAESVFRFRAVCKAWCRIIDDPSIIKSHTINQSSSTLLIRDSIYWRLFLLPLDSLSSTDAHPTVDLIRVKTLVRPNVPFLLHLPTTSCNGLILISHYNSTKTWVVWNPLTRECHELPDCDIDFDFDFEHPFAGVGFGYESANDDYKLVRIDRDFVDHKYKTHVYSLKSNSWKRISDYPCHFIPGQSEGVFLNGALHWISVNVIVVLDLGTEDYHLLSVPTVCIDLDQTLLDALDVDGPMPILDAFDLDGRRSMPLLDALGGNLFLSYYNIDFISDCFDLWMMKDYGVETSWMKLFSFGELDGIGSIRSLRPVAYLKSKGLVFLQHDDHFILVDLEKDSRKKVTIDGLPNEFSSQIFQGSLFRLDEGGSAERTAAVKRKKKKKRAGTRFKLNVTFTDILYHSDSE